jgi:hypothetical protein|nr:MAG TPA: hypothetical protein [Caudoviricetes sp.]
METNDLICVLAGEYGPLFDTIEMWCCIQSLGIKPYRNNAEMWCFRYGSIYGSGETIDEAARDFYRHIVNG